MCCDIISCSSSYFPSYPARENAVFLCEPALNQFAAWSRCGSLYFPFIPTFSVSPKTGEKRNNKSKSFSTDFPGCPVPSCLLGYLTICVDWGCDVKRAARTYVTDSRSADSDSRRRVTRRLDKLRGKKQISFLHILLWNSTLFAVSHYLTLRRFLDLSDLYTFYGHIGWLVDVGEFYTKVLSRAFSPLFTTSLLKVTLFLILRQKKKGGFRGRSLWLESKGW